MPHLHIEMNRNGKKEMSRRSHPGSFLEGSMKKMRKTIILKPTQGIHLPTQKCEQSYLPFRNPLLPPVFRGLLLPPRDK